MNKLFRWYKTISIQLKMREKKTNSSTNWYLEPIELCERFNYFVQFDNNVCILCSFANFPKSFDLQLNNWEVHHWQGNRSKHEVLKKFQHLIDQFLEHFNPKMFVEFNWISHYNVSLTIFLYFFSIKHSK